jgi:hypothetical protein
MKTLLLLFFPFFCFAQSETPALKKQRLRIEAGLKKEYNYTAAYLSEIAKFHKNKSTPAKIERKKAIALAYFENDYPKVEQNLAAYFKKRLDTTLLKSYFETVFIEKKVRKLQAEQPILNVLSLYPNAVIAILHQYKGEKLEYLLRFVECGFDRSPNIIKNKQQKLALKQLKTDFKRIKIKDFNLICILMR